jgi:hypothetical protein
MPIMRGGVDRGLIVWTSGHFPRLGFCEKSVKTFSLVCYQNKQLMQVSKGITSRKKRTHQCLSKFLKNGCISHLVVSHVNGHGCKRSLS